MRRGSKSLLMDGSLVSTENEDTVIFLNGASPAQENGVMHAGIMEWMLSERAWRRKRFCAATGIHLMGTVNMREEVQSLALMLTSAHMFPLGSSHSMHARHLAKK